MKDPYVSPLLHKNLKSLPKTYISVCGHDTLRDDGILFKEALDEAGYVLFLPRETTRTNLSPAYQLCSINIQDILIGFGHIHQNIWWSQ